MAKIATTATKKPRAKSTTKGEPADAATSAEVNAETSKTNTKAVNTAPAGLSGLFSAFDEVEEHLNVLYWGKEGAGKTINIAKATQRGRVLVINVEGGLKRHSLEANGVDTANLVVYPRPNEPLTYEGLEQAVFQVKADLMDNPDSWYLVAIDSITELYQALLDEVSQERIDSNMKRNPNWEPGTRDRFFVDLSDYGTATKMARKIVRILRDLPVHFALTALERRDVDEDTSKVAYAPAVAPALQTSLLGYMDMVLYCKAADEKRGYFRAQTKRVGAFRAKDRIGATPEVLVNPDFNRLVDYNSGVLTADTDPIQEVLTENQES